MLSQNELQEHERPGKLVAEPSGQKIRRSILKEFDPLAPDSPCPPRKNIKKVDTLTVDEEEIFEDAETSLTSYVCPRNKNIDKSPETSTKVTNETGVSWLIPDLRAEPSGQKIRRSILKEFDPLAPDSPCPPRKNIKKVDTLTVDEEEIFEDAETSLTSYVCPRNKNIDKSPETSTKVTNETGVSWLIPDLRDNFEEEQVNPNDTADMSYIEAVENLSQVNELDKTSSEHDLEFRIKKPIKNPDIIIQNSENNLFDIARGIEKSDSIMMVDSLETFDSSDQLNATIENMRSQIPLNKALPVEDQDNSDIIQKNSEHAQNFELKEDGHGGSGSMTDSLELPNSQNTAFSNGTCDKLQEVLIDSLEVLRSEEKVLNAKEGEIQKVKFTAPGDGFINPDHCASNEKLNLNSTFETLSIAGSQSDKCNTITVSNTSSEDFDIQKETHASNSNLNIEFEAPSVNAIQLNTNQLQDDQAEISKDNSELNKTFEASSLNTSQSNTDKLQGDQIDKPNTDVELNTPTEAPSSNTIQSKTDLLPGNQIDTPSVAVELNTKSESPSSNSVQLEADQFERDQIDTSSVNVNINNTFESISTDTKDSACRKEVFDGALEAPVPIILDMKTDQSQTDQINISKTACNPEDLSNKNVIEEATTNKILDGTVILDHNKALLEECSDEVECLDKVETYSKQIEPDMQQIEVCTENRPLDKVVDTPSNKPDTAIAENLDNKISFAANALQTCKQETVKQDHISSQSVTNDTHVDQAHFVSLKDIAIGKDVIQCEQTDSKILSFVLSDPVDANTTFIDENHAAESSKVVETLAQSLNQTIDVEESAIVDDINSSNSTKSSADSSREKLNVTIENSGVLNPEEKTEEQSNTILERRNTEKFEDLERRSNEKTQNIETCVQEAFDGPETVIKTCDEQKVGAVVEEEYSKVFYRQDTQEFEALERECSANDGITKENIKYNENVTVRKKSKVVKRQETKEFEDLERQCKASVQSPTELSEPLELKDEMVYNSGAEKNYVENAKILEAALEEPVKIRVSGNICNAHSVSDESNQLEDKDKEDFTGINLKYEISQEKGNSNHEQKPANKKCQSTTKIPLNGTDLTAIKIEKVIFEEVPSHVVITNDQAPKANKNIAKPKNRPECRPSTKSMRNKTQVIDRPIVMQDATEEIKQEKDVNNSNLIANEFAEKQLQEYKNKSEKLKNQVDKLQTEMEAIKNENMRKDKYILTCALDIEAERDNVVKFRKLVEEYEQTITNQNEDLRKLKEGEEKTVKSFTSLEMAFADVFEKYEKAKSIIEAYKKNEEILQRNIQCAEDQLTKLEAECSVMREQYIEKIKKVEDQVVQEKEKYRQDIAKLQTMVKRLEIKSSSLETALKQKAEECVALAALWDDITGKPI